MPLSAEDTKTLTETVTGWVAAGHMTPEQGKAYVAGLVAQANSIELTAAQSIATQVIGTPTDAVPGATVITSSGKSLRALAAEAIAKRHSSTIDAARAAIEDLSDAELNAQHGELIAAHETAVLADLQAAANRAYEESPEGREATLIAAEQAAAERARRVELGAFALRQEGLTDDDIATLTSDQILTASGLEQAEDTFRAGADDFGLALRRELPLPGENGGAS